MKLGFRILVLVSLVGVVDASTNGQDVDSHFRRSLSDLVEGQIVGGKVVSEKNQDFRWMVSLKRGGRHFCGASLIHENWIMTAAHCTSRDTEKIVIGSYDQLNTKGAEIRRPVKMVRHPEYEGITNDIALIRLDSPARKFTPVSLSEEPFQAPQEMDDQMASALGWGYTSEDGTELETKLRYVDVPIVSQARCSKSYGGIDSTKICAGYDTDGKDACSGDSGGPLVVNKGSQMWQVGITSYGRGCGRGKYYGVYARNSAFYTWIKETLAEEGDTLPKTTAQPTHTPTADIIFNPTPAPTSYVPRPGTEKKEYNYCVRQSYKKCLRRKRGRRGLDTTTTVRSLKSGKRKGQSKTPMCFWNNQDSEPLSTFPQGCLPAYLLPTPPTAAPTTAAPTPAPVLFIPDTQVSAETEWNYCYSKKEKQCATKVDRCFWNGKRDFNVKYLQRACLPNYIKDIY